MIGRLSLVISCICSIHSLGVSLESKPTDKYQLFDQPSRFHKGGRSRGSFHSALSSAPCQAHMNLLNKLFKGKGSFVIYLFLVDKRKRKKLYHTHTHRK